MTLHIFSIEAIDAAGKGVQTNLLADRLHAQGFKVQVLDFPRYATFVGKEIGLRLSGEAEMDAQTLPARDMSLWYALDRMLAFEDLKPDTQILLMNRSTYSNIGYQLARVPKEERPNLKEWLEHLEFNVLNIPKPHKVFFLDIDSATSEALVLTKGKREYLSTAKDVYEGDRGLLDGASAVYNELADTEPNFVRIPCMDATGQLNTITAIGDVIFEEAMKALKQ